MQNQNQSQNQQTGTRNETYDLISVLYHALQGAENCQTYVQDAQDSEVKDFFNKALQTQRQLADQGKQVLQKCLQKDTGSQSAFGWRSTGSQTGTGQTQSSGSQQTVSQTTGANG